MVLKSIAFIDPTGKVVLKSSEPITVRIVAVAKNDGLGLLSDMVEYLRGAVKLSPAGSEKLNGSVTTPTVG